MAHSATSSGDLQRYIDSKSPNICIVKFGNNKTCPPCRASHPIFIHAAEKYGKKCHFVDVDLGAAGALGGSYGIKSMPTFIYFKDGMELKRVTGASDLDTTIGAFVNQYGKTVFETGQGRSLGSGTGATATSTATATTAATTAASPNAAAPRAQRANNPWARKDFNPAAQMRSNAGIEEQKQEVEMGGEEGEGAPAGMVCKDGVCYFPTQGNLASSTNEQPPRSVCNGCSIM